MKLVKAPSAGRSRHSVAVYSTNGAWENRPQQLQSCAPGLASTWDSERSASTEKRTNPTILRKKKRMLGAEMTQLLRRHLAAEQTACSTSGTNLQLSWYPQPPHKINVILEGLSCHQDDWRSSGHFRAKAHQSACRADSEIRQMGVNESQMGKSKSIQKYQ